MKSNKQTEKKPQIVVKTGQTIQLTTVEYFGKQDEKDKNCYGKQHNNGYLREIGKKFQEACRVSLRYLFTIVLIWRILPEVLCFLDSLTNSEPALFTK